MAIVIRQATQKQQPATSAAFGVGLPVADGGAQALSVALQTTSKAAGNLGAIFARKDAQLEERKLDAASTARQAEFDSALEARRVAALSGDLKAFEEAENLVQTFNPQSETYSKGLNDNYVDGTKFSALKEDSSEAADNAFLRRYSKQFALGPIQQRAMESHNQLQLDIKDLGSQLSTDLTNNNVTAGTVAHTAAKHNDLMQSPKYQENPTEAAALQTAYLSSLGTAVEAFADQAKLMPHTTAMTHAQEIDKVLRAQDIPSDAKSDMLGRLQPILKPNTQDPYFGDAIRESRRTLDEKIIDLGTEAQKASLQQQASSLQVLAGFTDPNSHEGRQIKSLQIATELLDALTTPDVRMLIQDGKTPLDTSVGALMDQDRAVVEKHIQGVQDQFKDAGSDVYQQMKVIDAEVQFGEQRTSYRTAYNEIDQEYKEMLAMLGGPINPDFSNVAQGAAGLRKMVEESGLFSGYKHLEGPSFKATRTGGFDGDGDSFQINNPDGTKSELRLFGVNAPEYDTPEGKAAAKFTRELLDANSFKVIPMGEGYYGRTLGQVIFTSGPRKGQSLNEILVEEGHASSIHMEQTLAYQFPFVQSTVDFLNSEDGPGLTAIGELMGAMESIAGSEPLSAWAKANLSNKSEEVAELAALANAHSQRDAVSFRAFTNFDETMEEHKDNPQFATTFRSVQNSFNDFDMMPRVASRLSIAMETGSGDDSFIRAKAKALAAEAYRLGNTTPEAAAQYVENHIDNSDVVLPLSEGKSISLARTYMDVSAFREWWGLSNKIDREKAGERFLDFSNDSFMTKYSEADLSTYEFNDYGSDPKVWGDFKKAMREVFSGKRHLKHLLELEDQWGEPYTQLKSDIYRGQPVLSVYVRQYSSDGNFENMVPLLTKEGQPLHVDIQAVSDKALRKDPNTGKFERKPSEVKRSKAALDAYQEGFIYGGL